MPMKLCLDCGALFRPEGSRKSRCVACHAAKERTRAPRPSGATRDWRERQRRAQAVADHRATVGDVCPGWRGPAHAATDLTADHVDPVARGGDPRGLLVVLCRSCNSSKRAGVGLRPKRSIP